MVGRSALTLVLLFAAPAALVAQDECRPSTTSHEAQTFGITSVPLAYGPGGVVRAGTKWSVGLELASIPEVDAETATPTTCNPGKGPENTDLLPLLPRPRVTFQLPSGFFIEASWVPPVRVNGAKANLFGLAVGRRFEVGARTGMTLRAHSTLGVVHGPITCNEEAIQDDTSLCFNGTLSDDAYRPNIFGLDLAADRRLSARVVGYAGVGYNHLRPRFQVNFTDSGDFTDRTKVLVNLHRGVLFGGAMWEASDALSASGEIYLAPGDAMTVRMVLRRSVGP